MLWTVLPAFFLVTPMRPTTDAPAPLPHAALAAWQDRHGAQWRMRTDPETGFAEMLFGGGAALGIAPRDEVEATALARIAVLESAALHGVEVATLVAERALFLPLGQIGSGDKWTVRFSQTVGGLAVADAHVNVLIDAAGRLLSVQSTAVPAQAALMELPALSAEVAAEIARTAFHARLDVAPGTRADAVLMAFRTTTAGRRVARAAWRIDLLREIEGHAPVAERMWVDAADGALLGREALVHAFDVTGTVVTWATPGLAPDGAGNPPTIQAMKHVELQSSAGTVLTDANGNFTFAGVDTPLAVTVRYFGAFGDVRNMAGAEHTLTQVVHPVIPNTLTLNSSRTAEVTAQANAFMTVNRLRDWVRSVLPTDGTADRLFQARVNDVPNCPDFFANFNGTSIGFRLPGDSVPPGVSCANSSFSTVISHEHGHWMNVLYGTGNGSDGMGEGNADVFAMYVWDTPGVALDLYGNGLPIRTGWNTRQFCGDGSPGCHNGQHQNGEVWMGAAWKIRDRLNQTHGNAAGDLIADTLFLSWMNAYDQTLLRSIIETQWLTLDDDDANLGNGTPHYADIDGGFRAQGFPGIDLVPLAIQDVTRLQDTEDTVGSYTVDATVLANSNPPVIAATLVWRVSGGALQSTSMASIGGDGYRASIPGQVFPALVQYYVQAVDSIGRSVTWPSSAPDQMQSFDVGTKHPIATFAFDGVTNDGWTTGTVGGTSNPESDWARGGPAGRGGTVSGTPWRDPSGSVSGLFCWANDLGVGSNDGAYSANVHSFLRSPVINCSGTANVRLRFSSWLSVEGSANDQARVLVNGVEVYANPAATRVDTGWGMQEYDISALAAGNPAVQIEFRLRSNATNNFGGWAVDDLSVFWLSPIVPPCPAPAPFCATSPNSVGSGAVMGWTGTGNLITNNLRLFVYACPPGTTGQFYYGPTQIQTPFGNGWRCVGGTTHRLGVQTTDAFGDADRTLDLFALPSGPASAGQVWNFQFWYRNPAAGGAGFNLSDGLSVTICN